MLSGLLEVDFCFDPFQMRLGPGRLFSGLRRPWRKRNLLSRWRARSKSASSASRARTVEWIRVDSNSSQARHIFQSLATFVAVGVAQRGFKTQRPQPRIGRNRLHIHRQSGVRSGMPRYGLNVFIRNSEPIRPARVSPGSP